MSANVLANLASWSATAGSNQPDGTDTADIDAELRQIQSAVRKYLRSKGTDMASGTTVDLATADGDYIDITGTTSITGLGTVSAGMRFILQFDGILTLTNSASLALPGNADITTAAGDHACFESLGSGNWRGIYYTRAAVSVSNDEPNTFAIHQFTADGGETSVDLPFSYIVGGKNLIVMVNGLVNYPSDDYTEDDTNTITFTTALTDGDKVRCIANIVTTAYVPTDASLSALYALTPAADKFPYFTSGTAADLVSISAFVRSIMNSSDAAAFLTAIGAASAGDYSQFGVGQTWQDVKASRSNNTSRQNDSGKPIQVSILYINDVSYFQVSTNNSTWVTVAYSTSSDDQGPLSVIVPANHYYKLVGGGSGSIHTWAELR